MMVGSAWAAPIIVAGTAAPAFAASPCGTDHNYLLDWGSTPFNRTAGGISAYATVASSNGGPAVYVTFAATSTAGNVPDPARNLTIPPNTGTSTNLDPVVTSLGGIPGMRGVRLQRETSNPNRNSRQEVVVTFRSGSQVGPPVNVSGLNFYITDIDAITTSPYSDRVEVVPNLAAANQAKDAAITGLGTFASPWATTVPNSNVNENSAGARVSLAFPIPAMSQFTLTYWNDEGGSRFPPHLPDGLQLQETGLLRIGR